MVRKRRHRLVMLVFRLVCCLIAPALVSPVSPVQAQVTVGLFRSVFLIKYHDEFGTSFILRVDEKPYLITAAHLVEGFRSGEKVSLWTGWDKWEEFAVTRIPIPAKVDIAVFASDRPISDQGTSIEPGSIAGQDVNLEVYFLGFPYAGERTVNGRTYRLSSTFESGGVSYPAPLVKHGIISGVDDHDPDSLICFIDAMNNPGFSGGPVVFWDKRTNRPKVIAIVSGRLPDELMVPRGASPPPAWANSGIVIAHEISSALAAIRKSRGRGPEAK